jgi:hypothetical protein
MKKLILLHLLIFLLAPFFLHAQQQITGTVTDQHSKPLDGVTVTISRQNISVSSVLAGLGIFKISSPVKAPYTLTASLLGYKTYTRLVTQPADTLHIIMEEDSKALAEVTVSVTRPVIERKIDRVVFNVENSIIASGGSAREAIAKAPGVQVNSHGSIKANKKSVKVYMDGKAVALGADDLSSYLQSVPSEAIAKIEVFTNPPAKFDADGGAIINIITKKSLAQGLNITLNSGVVKAAVTSYRAGTQFNYQKDKLNLYGSYGYNRNDKRYMENNYITYATNRGVSFWDSDKNIDSKSNSSTYKMGADYQLNSKALIGFLFTGYNRNGASGSNTGTIISNLQTGQIDSLLQTTTGNNTVASQYTFNLNYNLKLYTNGKSLDFNIDYSPYRNKSGQVLDNYAMLSNQQPLSEYHIFTPATQNIDIYSAKLDYTSKLGRRWDLSSGLKYSSIQTVNDFDYFSNAGNIQVADPGRSDHFNYIERTAAAYTSLSGVLGKWTVNAGLRTEYTTSKGVSAVVNTTTERNYFKLFPTAYILYQDDQQNEWQLTYSYRIQRPEYFRLNPAKSYVNPYSFVTGNPLLQPSFVHTIELAYTYQKKYTVSGYYTVTRDLFTYITEQDNENNLLLTTQQNLGLSSNTGIRLMAPFQPASWWGINVAADGSYQKEKSAYLKGSYLYHNFSWNTSLDQTFTINQKAGLKAELNAWYRSPQIAGIQHINRTYDISAGIRKPVFNGQGTLRLTASDIFYGNAFRVESHYLSQNNGIFMKQDTRNLTLALTYQLGRNVKASRTRNTSNEEEKTRVR